MLKTNKKNKQRRHHRLIPCLRQGGVCRLWMSTLSLVLNHKQTKTRYHLLSFFTHLWSACVYPSCIFFSVSVPRLLSLVVYELTFFFFFFWGCLSLIFLWRKKIIENQQNTRVFIEDIQRLLIKHWHIFGKAFVPAKFCYTFESIWQRVVS